MNKNSSQDFVSDFIHRWNRKLKSVRWIGFALGLCLLFIGAYSFISPSSFARSIVTFSAVLLILFAIFRLVDYFTTPVLFRFSAKLVSAIFNLAIGLMLLIAPFNSIIRVVTVIIAIELMVLGIEKLLYVGKLRYFEASGYSWLVVDSIINLFAAFFFAFVPEVVTTALSILAGIFLVISGASVLLESMNAREYAIDEALLMKRERMARRRGRKINPDQIDEAELELKSKEKRRKH